MGKYVNGEYIPLTPAEIAALQPTAYELAMQDWDFHAYELRIPVPVRWFDPTNEELNPSQKRKVEQFMQWWQISEMPIHRKNGNTYGYCREIMPQHTQFLSVIGVTVEARPKAEDFD